MSIAGVTFVAETTSAAADSARIASQARYTLFDVHADSNSVVLTPVDTLQDSAMFTILFIVVARCLVFGIVLFLVGTVFFGVRFIFYANMLAQRIP